MIKDANRYYGSVLSALVDAAPSGLRMRKLNTKTAGFYLVEERIPIYIKYSTSRKGPWVFNFQLSHQEAENCLFREYGLCVIIFVCGKDGIAAIEHSNFRKILDDEFEEQESVVIRRKHNEMYCIRGTNGSLERKVSRSSLDDIFSSNFSAELETT